MANGAGRQRSPAEYRGAPVYLFVVGISRAARLKISLGLRADFANGGGSGISKCSVAIRAWNRSPRPSARAIGANCRPAVPSRETGTLQSIRGGRPAVRIASAENSLPPTPQPAVQRRRSQLPVIPAQLTIPVPFFCLRLKASNQLGRGDYRGMGRTLSECLMGQVSEDCGGNSTGS